MKKEERPRGLDIMPAQPNRSPRILAIVDAPGWAHDFKTRNLARVLHPEYEIVERFQNELTPVDLEQSDLVLVYYWHQFSRMSIPPVEIKRYREKLLCGICGHYELDGPMRGPGIDSLHQFASAVFVNNPYLLREFGPLLNMAVFYTPNGVDTAFFRPGPDRVVSAGFRAGWAGSLSNQGRELRGYDAFIVPAVKRVEGSELITAAREDRWRSPEEMREFYRSLDVYLCASRFEGTPNPCLEAAACGIPLVTTRVGNMPELIRDGINGFLVEPTVDDFANKLSLLKQDVRLREKMGRAACTHIAGWDWKIQANTYRKMFKEVLLGKRNDRSTR
ncbi:MAG TPA: glycosyltransferase family 4 protein [Terriglobia bacterium]|nr:glycosyltransferase family 4 protein [Terriglobia bacterium]